MKSAFPLSAEAYVGLGANLGNPEETFGHALSSMGTFSEVLGVSGLYRSKPYGFSRQPDFLNAAARIRTKLDPLNLLRKLQEIEKNLGKVVERENGPRLIDLDLLFYEDKVLKTDDLTLPHPEIHKRDFVLKPLEELNPDLFHPTRKKTISELLKNLDEKYVSGKLSKDVTPFQKSPERG